MNKVDSEKRDAGSSIEIPLVFYDKPRKVALPKSGRDRISALLTGLLTPTGILKAYKQLAAGRWVKHYNQQTGEYLYSQWEVDGPTLRHWINKLVPDAAQEIRLDGRIAHTVIINTRDPDAEA